MKNNTNKFLILLGLIVVYILLKKYIPYWHYIVYPINLLVTFLHEFGHATWALITWWSVSSIEINSDWSWLAWTSWWWRSIVLMGWYIWSAIFWNILLYIWLKKEKLSEIVIYCLSGFMVFTAIIWFSGIISSIILFLIAGVLLIFAKKTDFDSYILSFLWVASLVYIIEDFNGWPSSDLAKFSELFIIVPQFVWMYTWLLIVLAITAVNLKFILFKK